MKKYFKYILICFAMFFSFNSLVNAEPMRICRYEFKNYYQGGKKVYVNVYVTEAGISAYYNDKSFIAIGETNSKPLSPQFSKSDFMSGDIETSACPKEVSIPPYDLLNEGKLYLGLKAGYVALPNVGSEFRDGDVVVPDPGDGEVTVDPPGGGDSIFTGSCPSNSGIVPIIRALYNLLKIAAPLALVIYGVIDFGKAVIASDEGVMKKAQSAFIRRILAAICVILVLAMVSLLSKLIPSEAGVFSCVEEILK